jgi:hypothetical protein
MFSSSRNSTPLPSRGRNSGGYQRETPFSGTGRPRRSVGASWLRRRSMNPSSCSAAACATTLDFPMPGGPQIITLRVSLCEMSFER